MAITGSIAAVKSYDAIRIFQKNGYDVQCVVSSGGEKFISRLALESLSGYPVLGPDIFSFKNSENENLTLENYNKKNTSEIFAHIECTKNIEAIVVLPASANFLANFAHGRATDFLSATMLANVKPVLLCPAMNSGMWENKVVQNNIKIIQNIYKNTTKLEIINPQNDGVLACGDIGAGKLAHLENIFLHFQKLLEKNKAENKNENKKNAIQDKTILINMGGTQEKIDPVRCIGNFSSGETGKIIAEQCFILGAKKVICIIGNVSVNFENLKGIKNFEIIKLENNSAQEMLEATEKYSKNADIVIFSAAVSDFTPKKYSHNKIKKYTDNALCALDNIELSETVDIAQYISNKYGNNKKIFIGFALETEENNAKRKIIIQKKSESKNLDYIFGNAPKNFNQKKNSNAYHYSLYSKKTQNFLDISEFLNENKDVFFRKILKSLL